MAEHLSITVPVRRRSPLAVARAALGRTEAPLAAALVLGGLAMGMVLGRLGGMLGPAFVVLPVLLVIGGTVALYRPQLATIAVILSLPFGFAIVLTFPITLQVIDLVTLAAIGAAVLHRLLRRESPLPWPAEYGWVLALVLWAMLSTPHSILIGESISQDIQLATVAAFGLTVMAVATTVADIRRLGVVLLGVGAVVAAWGLSGAGQIKAEYGATLIDNRVSGVFAQPNDYGNWCALLLVVSIAWWFSSRRPSVRWVSGLAMAACALGLAVSFSRGAMIGTTVGLLALLLLMPAIRRRALVGAGIMVLLFFSLFVTRTGPPQVQVVGERIGTIVTQENSPYDDRPAIWGEAFRQIREQQWVGYGPATFPEASARSRPPGIFPDVQRRGAGDSPVLVGADHAHNVLLTVGAELGFPAILFVLGFTVALGRAALRGLRLARDNERRALIAGPAAALVAMAAQGLVDFTLRNPVLATLTWLLVGLLLAGVAEAARSARQPDVALAEHRR